VTEGVWSYLNTPNFEKLEDLIDPYTYLKRFKDVAKYIIVAAQDEVFAPDSINAAFGDLSGLKFLRVVPEVGHLLMFAPDSLEDATRSISTFVLMVSEDRRHPQLSWRFVD
jgi:PhoPQ-activated pathogenicity-related protein